MKFNSALITDLSGSVGGLTFFATRERANVARLKGGTTNPNTGYQVMVRSAMAGCAALWKSASDTVRTG